MGKACEVVKSEGILASLQLKQVVWAALVRAGLEWPLHHPKLAGAPRKATEVWEKRPRYLECGKESEGFMYNFLSSESKIVINKPKEATGRRIKHECLSFLRSWKLRGIQIASFTVGFDSKVTWPKLPAVRLWKGICKVTSCHRDEDFRSGKNKFGISELLGVTGHKAFWLTAHRRGFGRDWWPMQLAAMKRTASWKNLEAIWLNLVVGQALLFITVKLLFLFLIFLVNLIWSSSYKIFTTGLLNFGFSVGIWTPAEAHGRGSL